VELSVNSETEEHQSKKKQIVICLLYNCCKRLIW